MQNIIAFLHPKDCKVHGKPIRDKMCVHHHLIPIPQPPHPNKVCYSYSYISTISTVPIPILIPVNKKKQDVL